MCGIAGFFGNKIPVDGQAILRRMLTRIKHRGPDESGVYLSDRVGLGSVRLSIIDLKSGTMPLDDADGRFWIVFNGEIFNYIELRGELMDKGYVFRTQSDTEVIVNLYKEFGATFLQKLNGQFAIAIWDNQKEELFLARDRVGIRPLFYTQLNDFFVFGSEIKAMLEFPDLQMKLSPKALAQYFTFWTSMSPDTLFENIFEVQPGSFMLISESVIEQSTYWELPIYKPGEFRYTELKETKDQLNELLTDAVSLRLRADVPVAAYLSGGIDSSVTTALIKELSPANLRTFSIGFEDKDFDESYYQRLASSYFNTQHTSFSCSIKQIAEEFKNVVWHAEAPLLRTAPTPMSLLAKNVRENGIKVVITGEGADELLGGYNIFKEAKIRQFWAKDPQSKIRPLLLKKLYPYLPQIQSSNPVVLKMFFGYQLNQTESPFYSHLLRWHNTSRIINYLSEEYKKEIKDYHPIQAYESRYAEKLKGYDTLTKAQWIEINLFLSGYLLSSQGDRMGMAHSVEGRYPFLDYRVIEFCMGVSPDLKLKGLNEKYLLKKMSQGMIPDQILNRSKQAYRAPIRNTFASDNLPEDLADLISEAQISQFGIFNWNYVNQLLDKIQKNKQISEVDNMALTAVLSVQLLYDLYVNKSIGELKESELIRLNKTIVDYKNKN